MIKLLTLFPQNLAFLILRMANSISNFAKSLETTYKSNFKTTNDSQSKANTKKNKYWFF